MSSPIRDKDSNSYLVVHTNKMSMLKELGVLAAVCMLNQQGCNKTLEVYVDNSGAVFAFINIDSQSLGVNVVVTDITQRSDTGSCVADNLSKADTSTLGGFMKNSKRALLIPNTISEWMKHLTKDNYSFGHKIVEEIKNSRGTRAVHPYTPKFKR